MSTLGQDEWLSRNAFLFQLAINRLTLINKDVDIWDIDSDIQSVECHTHT